MPDVLSTVQNLMNEHEAIRGHMKLVRESVHNLESLEVEAREREPQYVVAATEKREALKQVMGYLADGLSVHHEHEDAVMPQLVGELIMQAIRLEHADQFEKFQKLYSVLTDPDINHFLEQLGFLKTSIENLCQETSLHSLREDGILYFLRKLPQ